MERERRLTRALSLLSIIGVAYFSLVAFSEGTRKEIGRRDNWTCECGRAFKDGYFVTASHYNHDKNHPDYDKPEMGRIQCTLCHARVEKSRGNLWGAQKLLDFGIYTREAAARRGGNVYLKVEDI